ncbi:MAG: Sensor histidine kinase RcsC [Verrucomicrobiae bacterium]|nr:Sensor histidine kinase RcsC [Verrucomicrobiae bacterium]
MKNEVQLSLNLQAKVALVAVTSLVIVASALTIYYSQILTRAAQAADRERIMAVASGLANQSTFGLRTQNKSLLQDAAVRTLTQPEVVAATIFDRTGRVMAAAGKITLQEKRRVGPDLASRITVAEHLPEVNDMTLGRIGRVCVPVYLSLLESPFAEYPADNDQKLGVVEVTYSMAGTALTVARARHSALLLTSLLVLIWSLLISFSARKLVRPLRELLSGTKELAAGNLSARVTVTSRDEIGALAGAFNQMGERLQASHREVLDQQRNLEHRVTERTLELSAANARLMQEIVDRKNSELRLREAETKYRTVVEQLPAITYIADYSAEGKWNYVSPQISSILGFSITEWQADPTLWERQMHPDDRAKAIAAEQTSRQTGLPFSIEYRMHDRDGRVVWFADRGVVLCDLAGKTCSVHGVMLDMTDRKRLEQQFLQAQKVEAVGRLAGGVAHDFNNILTAILGYSELILRRVQPGDPIRVNGEQIQKAAERAASLTRQLLAFSRKQVLEPRVFNLNDVILDLEKMLRRLIGEDIQFISMLGPQLAMVRADPAQIEQVIMNLVVNARDAMPERGTLTLKTANVTIPVGAPLQVVPAGDYVTFRVTDTGVGMTEETKAHLFEPFFTTKPVGAGTGLGLATCFGIIQQSTGHITVESELSKGTTFTIYLPAINTTVSVNEPAATEPATPRGSERILLVEDEPAIRELAALELRELGYAVHTAGDGAEALEVLQATGGPVELLVTDVVMPKMGGPELADALRHRYRDTRVLFTSGYTADTIGRHGVLDEGISFLRKPFTSQTLARKVREVLDEDE